MKRLNHQPDYTLIILFGVIVVFGLIMLSSATSVLGYDKFEDSYWYLKHQIMQGLLPGLFLFLVLSRVDYRLWKKFSAALLWFSLGLLVLVFIPGIGADYGKAKSWLNIGGFSLQPAEIVKLTFLVYLAAWLEKRKERVQTAAYGLVPFLVYLGLVGGLIILQPDIGTLFIIILMSLVVFYTAGARYKHLFYIMLAGVAGLAVLIKAAPYRLDRLSSFLDPSVDPQGIGYHINQALLAVGSGGWFGLGLGHSEQKFQYLPEVAGDSIFAVMAEELGFVLILAVIVVFLWLFVRMMKVAKNAPDMFGNLIGVGVATWLVGQFFVNVAAMLRLMPLTGVPLPLISYGGTAMMTAMAGIGIVVNISKHTQQNMVVDASRVRRR
ncbi:putative lipid II flippase FtsW [Candidatus Kuenenbacteria bacterium CG_4_8_14_3_um_filter_39_15]|uniref:Probable peptidoglycan glycosyltransferase FtsW n=6 Tax=Candidatus Kueneniibacteriota TaxID=1752740 RepID=A0A2M7IME2_9BACT|nr:MAG: putative lipid II flippase FtsW [Candidatus Kuenenbacteria bacterium CG2_30_39_24]PIP28685.1 MAG: putative lipid II flippase FtsW [Candidatus Kuenenbacteria bacterium CG23_combo_of_CG06-09_8_20_14_all_39_39]PIP75461.1 MAG: putative lipid II flippase FtsW [Candidatus Kuenenbacteria bacterium CG22_combo_CG10-13_8_21_14_all_39_9]PIR80741.1 MAG: putative lipid II flippase FtsW [Candidatus Kuenenbacteria bacterium CG10_big_fil_rev_8_21_14_0_10_39_14]PIW95960.1 MAG: putative lipid II flippase